MKKYTYTFETFGRDGQPQIEVAFDSCGQIGAIFLYNEDVDTMVLADLEAFERRHPSKYNYLQEKVNELLTEINQREMFL